VGAAAPRRVDVVAVVVAGDAAPRRVDVVAVVVAAREAAAAKTNLKFFFPH
jgi:hypothetical protein